MRGNARAIGPTRIFIACERSRAFERRMLRRARARVKKIPNRVDNPITVEIQAFIAGFNSKYIFEAKCNDFLNMLK